MGMTEISGPVAAVLCAGALAVAAPTAAAAPPAPAASVVASPAQCLSGVRRVQVTCRHTPSLRLYVVESAWLPFTTAGAAPCLKNGGSATPS
ncbi:hypothetical protein PV458_40650 [Streptomyces sp. MN03-5084-2B]|nr:hypothetical protein [Streptomyces sp. MN03-5084-2B]